MKRLLLLTLILSLFLTTAHAANFTVSQSGVLTDYSVADFNALTGDKGGNTYYFDTTANITTKVSPQIYGTSGNPVTFDGYQGGDYDPIGAPGGTHCTIDLDSYGSGDHGISLNSTNDYIIIQDFEIRDCGEGIVYGNGTGGSDHITIRRNYIHHIENRGIFGSSNYSTPNTYITIGGASGDGNNFKNIGSGTAGYDVKAAYTTDCIISYNKSWADGTEGNYGTAGISWEGAGAVMSKRFLIEYNEVFNHNWGSQEDGIGGKSGEDFIIRFNDVYGHDSSNESMGISAAADVDGFYIYGNRVWDNAINIFVTPYHDTGDGNHYGTNGIDCENVHIWANVIYKSSKWSGIQVHRYADSDEVKNVNIYNNTICENATNPISGSVSGIGIGTGVASSEVNIKNNILYKNRPNEADYVQMDLTNSSAITSLEHDQYYWPGQTSVVYYSGGDRSVATLQASYGLENDAPAGADGDPGFNNAAGYDYTLTGGSACKDNGKDLSGLAGSITVQGITYNMYWDDCLDDSYVDWSTFPPTVRTVDQDTYGSWERGAYVYTGGAVPSAALSGTAVSGNVLESEVVAGGETIIITLSNCEWEATVGDNNALTTALIAGIDSAQSEANGWDAEVKADLDHTDIVRTNDTVVTITLPAEAAYAITANETITITVPDSCITSTGTTPVASPTFLVLEDDASVILTLTGTVADNVDESEIIAGGETIILTVTNTTWDADVGNNSAETTALIAGMDSNQAQAGGWDAQMITAGELDFNEVVRTSDTVVTVTLPAVAAYSITINETVTVDVPDSCLAAAYLGADPTFVITHSGDAPSGLKTVNTVTDYSKINTVPAEDIVEMNDVPF